MRRSQVHNFSAGASAVDTEVLLKLQSQMLNFEESGMSLLEMSQRDIGGPVQRVIREAEESLRTLLSVPDNYKVLFMHGGAHAQFSGVPLNLLKRGSSADYICTGLWSRKAAKEASRQIPVRELDIGVEQLNDPSSWDISEDAAYVHLCANETISGVAMNTDFELPGKQVLVADMTSTLISRPIDIAKYGCIYASSGKNLGPAGVCVIIVREDLLEFASDSIPLILSWKMQSECQNIYNTPNHFGIWAMKEVVDQYLRRGGMDEVHSQATKKAGLLYDTVDSSKGFYTNAVPAMNRSLTAVPFHIQGGNPSLEELFIEEAAKFGIVQIFGHASVGGLRAAIYNALPMHSVHSLVRFMRDFQSIHEVSARHGSLT